MQDISQKLLKEIDKIAIDLIPEIAENYNFRKNPDSSMEHDPNWHQFGIITHTIKFAEFYRTEAKTYFDEWGISFLIDKHLSELVDDKPKSELLSISIPLHDIGKFLRSFKLRDGVQKPDYSQHEAKSEQVILQDGKIKYELMKNNLTQDQIYYIARCAGLHYELGKVRVKAKQSALGYTLEFAKSKICRKKCIEIAAQFPEFKIEIGILFLCDSLAKTDITLDAKNDMEIAGKIPYAESLILEQGLNPLLIAAIKQKPVNIAVAKIYLKSIFTFFYRLEQKIMVLSQTGKISNLILKNIREVQQRQNKN